MTDVTRYIHNEDAADAIAAIREGLQDTVVGIAPESVRFRFSDRLCETWVMQTAMGVTEIIFYFNGQVVLNTAPYDPDVLTWITAKAQLIKLTGHLT